MPWLEKGRRDYYCYIGILLLLSSSPSMSCVDGRGEKIANFIIIMVLLSAQNKMAMILFHISFLEFQRWNSVTRKIIFPEKFRVRRYSAYSNLKLSGLPKIIHLVCGGLGTRIPDMSSFHWTTLFTFFSKMFTVKETHVIYCLVRTKTWN